MSSKPNPTISATRQAAATRSHATSSDRRQRSLVKTCCGIPTRPSINSRCRIESGISRSARRCGLLGGADFGRPLDRLPGLAPPCDVSPRRHGHPADAERDAGQDIADEMDAEHDARQRDGADDQGGGDDGGNRGRRAAGSAG